ncbi:MAG: dTMP kinase [Rhodospirillaceae bacterium]|nr:dTMP kinase [Rhodospirillaceae bacterium]
MATGFFITLEGGEGGGKSTQAKLLGQALQRHGRAVTLTREPGGSPGAEAIRALLVRGDANRWDGLTEALLHYAARRDHVECTVRPALAAGRVVISDRFADSTTAYQGYGHGLDLPAIASLHRLALGDFMPNLTFILDLTVEKGLLRAAQRGGNDNRYETMGRDFHERLRQGFLAIAARDPARCVVVDADRSVEDIHRDLWTVVDKRLRLS